MEDTKTSSNQDARPALVVALGASAGGVAALREFFHALTSDANHAFIVIQHLDAGGAEPAVDGLRQFTSRSVELIGDATVIRAGGVYLVPPRSILSATTNQLSARPAQTKDDRHAVIDLAFAALAAVFRRRLVSVVLSGEGSDGTKGTRRVRETGGLTIAQTPTSAAHPSMPESAIASGSVDRILPAARIGLELRRQSTSAARAEHPHATDSLREHIGAALSGICEALLKFKNHDFRHYKSSTLIRRVQRRMQILHLDSVDAYLERLLTDGAEADALFDELLINVTEFFRDPEVFDYLAEKILAKALAKTSEEPRFRIWVPGCSTGEEAYTIAILIREQLDRLPHAVNVQIIATDIDEHALNEARKGIYPLAIERSVSPERLAKYFVRKGGAYHVAKDLREMCLFSAHNLVNDPPFSRLDLISCRNVLIYLGPPLQRKLIPLFHYALRPGGHLLLGPSETLNSHGELFRTVSPKYRLARRRPTAVRAPSFNNVSAASFSSHLRDAPRRQDADLHLVTQRMVLDQFLPKYAVVSEDGDVVSVSAGISEYFEPSEGTFDRGILKLLRHDLRLPMRAVLKDATEAKRHTEVIATTTGAAGEPMRIGLVAQPMPRLGGDENLVLIVFREFGFAADAVGAGPARSDDPNAILVSQLERELSAARLDLDRTVQDLEASNEELKSSNEELLSMNEELQSANEELEASKEEVQRFNEALQRSNTDLENLLNSTKIATLFLDDELKIRNFTPAVSDIYRIQSGDLGRHIGDFTSRAAEMPPITAESGEVEVRMPDDRTYLRRTLPYLTHDQRVDGIVITFVDVTEVRRSEQRFRALVQASAQMVWATDAEGHINEDSASWRRYTGQTTAEWLGTGWLDVVHPDDRERSLTYWRECTATGRAYDIEYRLRHVSGQWRWSQGRATPILAADGTVRGWVGMNIDINERKIAQINYERNVDASPAILWITELDGSCSYLSKQWYEFTGQTREEALGFGWLAAVHPDDSVRSADAFTRANADQTTFYVEYRLRTKDGSYRWAIDAGNPRFDQDGVYLGMAGTVFDIHDRRRAEEARRESEARFQIMADSAPVLVWMAGVDGGLNWFNRGWLTWTGRSIEDEAGDGWAARIHPDDRERCSATYAGSFADRAEFSIEFRLLHHSGEYRWISVRGVPRFTSVGTFAGYIGGCMDINEERAIGERLRESEARFRAITDAMPQMVWSTTPDGAHDYFNMRWYEFTGATPGSTNGAGWEDILHPGDVETARSAWAYSLMYGAPYQVEYRLRHVSGEYRWALGRALPVRNADGVITRWMGTCTDIHDRRLVAESLRMSEERYRVITEVSPQIVWSGSADGELNYFNQVWCDFTGMSIDDSRHHQWLGAVHPEHRDRVRSLFTSAVTNSTEYEAEVPFRRGEDGVYRWHLIKGRPVRDAAGAIERWVGVATDVHETKTAADRIKANENLLKSITDNTASSLFMMDRRGHPTFMNPAAEQLTGYTLDEISGRPLHYSIHYRKPDGSYYPMEECPIDNAQAELTAVKDQPEIFVDKSGRLFPVSFSVSPLERDGRVEGSVLEFRDVSSQKTIEDELRAAKTAAENANDAKSTFLANMSHEIRTPLGAIVGFSDLIKDEVPADSAAGGYVSRILRNSAQLSQLIDELLDLSKIEAKRLQVERHSVDVNALIEDVFAAVGLQAREKGIECAVIGRDQVPSHLTTDSTRLKQILINLVGNAVKFSDRGRVTVDLRCRPDWLEVRVIDHGIGLKDEQRQRLFLPFSQADSSITRKYGGTGLGLALSRELARLLGGDIVLEASAPGLGSTFKLTLPYAADDKPSDSGPKPASSAPVRSLEGRFILVVDDSPDNQMLVTQFLERSGARSECAGDGIEAVAKARGGQHDIILMDLQMPRMDGYSALKALRAEAYAKPIVALTAHALKSERDRCFESGFDGYVTKPIDRRVLIQTIQDLLS